MNRVRPILVACCILSALGSLELVAGRPVDETTQEVWIPEEIEEQSTVSPSEDLSIESIKRKYDFDEEEDEEDDDDAGFRCCICYGGFKTQARVELACGHDFHERCLQDFFRKKKEKWEFKCFLCQKPLYYKDGSSLYDHMPLDNPMILNRLRLGVRSSSRLPPDFRKPKGDVYRVLRDIYGL